MSHLAQIQSQNPNIFFFVPLGGWGGGGCSVLATLEEDPLSSSEPSEKRYNISGYFQGLYCIFRERALIFNFSNFNFTNDYWTISF